MYPGLRRGFGLKKFEFVELFAGIGGFHLGLSSVGGKNVLASEWDKHAALTYAAWFPNVPIETGDVRSLDIEADIPKHDILCGGFPCQPFSLAGVSKKNSLGRAHGFEDERQGNLFFTIRDIAIAHRPKVIFLENVKHLSSHDGGKTWKTITSILEQLGYLVHAKVIDASSWVPQHRERLYIVAFDSSAQFRKTPEEFSFPKPAMEKHPHFGDILDEVPNPSLELTEGLWTYLQAYAAKHKEKGNGFGYQIANPSGVSRTLSARYYKDGSEILIVDESMERPRKLSYNEARRLMGFTEEFAGLCAIDPPFSQVSSYSQSLRQLGNAVVPKVIQEIGRSIKSHL